MLYDKRWDKPEVKADPFTLDDVIAWLETMPADKPYDYENCSGRCLYGLYAASRGYGWNEVRSCSMFKDDFRILIYDKVACRLPWTFGAALDRARKALAA